ncbi:cell wall integrity and stress response component 1-like [Rhododendron vialii]|uniref:cell wall integrity and stress response component 1-like n=1 Tax=Rhododendron vialii TaxID=182163 RepID=UPI00265E17D3|nr:cell wall integrity and stress response component 1-like [Rhododendron vialii]
MALSSRRKTGSILRSLSPTPSSSYSAFASSTSTFSSRSTATATATSFFHRPTSPSSQSVRFSLDRPTSPSRSISSIKTQSGRPMTSSSSSAAAGSHNRKKQTCMCSPTTHPGSFRCSLHKNVNSHHHSTAPYPSNRLNARRSAMTNSLVRIGTVEGDLVKRALAALIRPSSHQQRRRVGFQPRRSRLSVMSKAEEHL